MDTEQRARFQIGRANHYFNIMGTLLICYVLLAGIIAFTAGGEATLALAAAAVGCGLFGILAGDSALKDLKNLRDSMDEETAASPYGVGAKATPYAAFRAVSAAVNFVVVLAILLSL